jgi:hypothetical protein
MKTAGAPIRSYRDLLAWQKAMGLAESAYRLSQKLPCTELYGLSSQIHRSASARIMRRPKTAAISFP